MSQTSAADIRSVVKTGLVKSMVSLLIKVATAGLAYLMFVVLSRSMGANAYGKFAFGFALATMLSIGAAMGQQTAILRFWPENMVARAPEKALNALKSGWALVIMAGSALCLALVLVALVLGLVNNNISSFSYLFAASLLILPMAAAEYGSSVLRAQGSVWPALLPRDIVWRVLVPVSVWLLYLNNVQLSGAKALALTALLLSFAMGLQFVAGKRAGYANGVGFKGVGAYWGGQGKASSWFLAGTVLDSAALNMDVVLVGLFVASHSAGIYFNAFRTAGLMTLFMFAITLVIAPMVSRHYHAGELARAQAVTSFCAWAGFLFSVGIFVVFLFFGPLILSLFGPDYSQGAAILVILSVGLLADAATGPTRIVMMMTGHEKAYVRIFGSIMGVGFILQLVAIPLFGLLGAAIVNAGSRIVAQTAIAIWTHKHVGIDTSLLGVRALFAMNDK
ncbi:hypothetical protein MNBD_ALPHA12-44 [hydrothermal vent metagenome]|uniref:Uncharacterized protein n=1 Tax=hydrothermal vent metagenome TaxID=652676 RepID=A0A3B0U859_9ZZZZ